MIDVVAAILKQGDKILIARRKEGKSLGGYWEFPGGKIEEGESPEKSLIRELKEEMMIDIKVTEPFGENIHDYGDKKIRLIAFWGEIDSGEIVLKDHDCIEWVFPKDLHQYNFSPADVSFVEQLMK
ncbi:(deoxy)nucleoside triphosphate pyrophosphohydrolase [Alkaliphilus hydrothermalis]|uniref:8-oxo-dGTP diphosphatase n=1 Tax=Alkaliphilus hydrothermalis TaxID=1482730 RepID=A0ABS2NPS8_9FIRM|nr:8-oxo-dGTP diphosphatase [Alkaliphilus hydrothermalis]